ncbi:MAG: histidine phosphatase family protein [Bacteroidetes bacterium]|nr:histidine phosphatase family protein [Bacteroidota bacterium]MCH8523374.1 histidine phosphatase family protein [Balneolales bacterium]
MKVFLIRHTPTVAEKGIIYGSTDLDIAEPYEPLFNDIARFLWPKNLADRQQQQHLFYSSPLIRCSKMAEYMAEHELTPSEPIVYDDRLREIDFGTWEMKRWADIPRDEIDAWMGDFVNAATPEGESFAQVMKRSVAFWDEFIMPLCAEPLDVLPGEVSTASVKTVASEEPVVYIFGHGGVLRAILCHVLGIEMEHSFKLILRHGSVTQLEINRDNRRTRLIHLSRGGVEHSY